MNNNDNNEVVEEEDDHIKISIIRWNDNNNGSELKLDWSRIHNESVRNKVDFPDVDKEICALSSTTNNDEQQQQQQQQKIVKKLMILYEPHRTLPCYFFWKNNLTRNLTELYLRKCKFTSLPVSIGHIENLEILELRGCAALVTIPESIFEQVLLQRSLKCLEILYCNKLETLPSSIGQLRSLTQLSINYCPISVLPRSIGKLSSMEQLDLRDLDVRSLPDEFCNLTNLERLHVHNLTITSNFFDVAKSIPHLELLFLGARVDLLNRIPVLPQLKSLGIYIIEATPPTTAPTTPAVGLRLLDDKWKENSSLSELSINSFTRNGVNVNVLGDLPRTLQNLFITNCKIENVLDSLMNESLPQGLQVLSVVNWHRPSYSTSERIGCIGALAERYDGLGRIRISESGRRRGFDFGLVQVPLPVKEAYLLKFNRCGRMLIQRGNNQKDVTVLAEAANANMTRRTLPLSVWSIVFERVHDIVNREIVGYCRLHKKEELQEIEASILFQFLRGGAFLSCSNNPTDTSQTEIDMNSNITTLSRKRRIDDCSM